jgi:hypothetical protein
MSLTRLRHALRVVAWPIIPALVIGSIWLPVVRQYQVPDPRIDAGVIEQARRIPEQGRLEEVRADRLLVHGLGTAQTIEAAESLLRGEFRLGDRRGVPFRLPFDPENLVVGSAVTQLYVAGLMPADILFQAYEATKQEMFFSAARASIVAFAQYERKAWWPRGLLWNDHAAANRVFVLSDFWRVYRLRPDFDVQTARAILTLAGRSGEVIADPRRFAFAGNHGVMQNTGLLRLRLSFPALPRSAYFQRLALERLGDQLPYYISDNGVVLEHSAGYQFFGVELLRLTLRYARLMGVDVPGAWEDRLQRAVQFSAQLLRPDGTLPIYGDTGWGTRWPDILPARRGPLPERPVASTVLDPVGGYAVWWDGLEHWPDARLLRQTLLTFSYFPGHLHKHADELSVLLWAGGQTWWTDVGYRPFDHPERRAATSWNGSSAPHLVAEPADSDRVARALAYGSSKTTAVSEASREGPGGYRVRRQVVYVKPDTWLIIDAVTGAARQTSITRWTTGYGLTIGEGEIKGPYILRHPVTAARLFVSYFGSPGVRVRSLPSALGPLGGSGPNGETTVAGIEVSQPADDSWAATTWLFDQEGILTPRLQPKMMAWHGPEDWSVMMPGDRTVLEISRRGDRITVVVGNQRKETVALERVDASAQRQEIIRAFRRAEEKYPRFPLRLRYRLWTTYALIGGLVVQEMSFLAIRRRAQRYYDRLRVLTLPLWVAGGLVLAVILGW